MQKSKKEADYTEKKIKKNLQKKKTEKGRYKVCMRRSGTETRVGKVVKYTEMVGWWWGHNKNPEANKKQRDKLSSLSSKTWDFIGTAESQFCSLFP